MKKVFAFVFTVMMIASMALVPVSASSGGTIATDKSEYLEGEMIHVEFEFPAKDTERQIWIYKGEIKMENRIWVVSATGTANEGYHPIFWPENTIATPGDYTMVVMKKNGDAYESDITATFTVKANLNLSRRPTISLDKDTYGLEDIITVRYDGVTDALPWNKILQITIYDDMDFPASNAPIYLWDTRVYNGISGSLEIDLAEFDLWEGDFYAILESNDESMDLSYSRVDFKIADTNSSATNAPEQGGDKTPEQGGDETPEMSPTPSEGTDATVPPTTTDEPSVVPTQAPTKTQSDNTLLYVVIGIAAALGIALVVVVVLLVKKKK